MNEREERQSEKERKVVRINVSRTIRGKSELSEDGVESRDRKSTRLNSSH